MSINPTAGSMAQEEFSPPRPVLPDFELIELIFFAYRDFVGEPDRLLARTGFGRAHHRVLHFVARNPGLTIAALLDILQITKQSLARVLRELVDQGFVEQRAGADDRRQRRLFATAKGTELATALASAQDKRISAALAAAGPDSRAAIARFLDGLIDIDARTDVRRRIAGTSS
ncbi:MAG: MarR family winged helix-turn-helix transcriptional regulator [Beijerinckiaceae bacterium]